jgi:hypothetical protein
MGGHVQFVAAIQFFWNKIMRHTDYYDSEPEGGAVFELDCSRESFTANATFICETIPEDAEVRHFYCPDCDSDHLRVILPDRYAGAADQMATYLAGGLVGLQLPRTWIN